MTERDKTADELLEKLFRLKLPIAFDPLPIQDDDPMPPDEDSTPPSGAVPGRESGKLNKPPAAGAGS